MSPAIGWFLAGLVGVSLLAMYQPEVAGLLVILLVAVLAINAQKSGALS